MKQGLEEVFSGSIKQMDEFPETDGPPSAAFTVHLLAVLKYYKQIQG
ncbi:hypothetical protein [Heyndrickxia acidicola]|uniref:Uncharacterized protein n=1 Tax=Heyndrickxia acidicola TaxID=209389 RepID=A0ABU6MCF6_9BACI|nr:hypothetical protein [Heyndrickxia acidicola]MED1202346.1 hypothetical protein [Heyndrickxia acidicola]